MPFRRQKVHIFDLKTMKAATTRVQWNAVERSGTVGYGVLKSIRHPLYRMVPPSDVCWFINPMNTIDYSYICHKP